jgi:hypothetical protein
MRLEWLGASVLAIGLASCAPHKIYDPVERAPSNARSNVNLVVTETHKLAPDGLAEQLIAGTKDSGAFRSVTANSELPSSGVPGPACMLTFEIEEYDVTPIKRVGGGGDPTAAVVLYSTSILIIPAFFLGTVRERTEQKLTFTASLRNLADAPLEAEKSPSGTFYQYDLEQVEPIFRQRYVVDLAEGRNWLKSELDLGRSKAKRHREEVANQYANRMLNAALPDVIQALQDI